MNNIYVRLAKTNIKNNRQLYLPYIISGIVTVMMFYLMMFINNNPGLKSIPGSVNLKTIMALGVGIITIFAYIFIFYTNSFIIKRRKKEIGVYNILGMENIIPDKIPPAMASIATKTVSNPRTLAMCRFSIPRILYTPISFFRRLIIKLLV